MITKVKNVILYILTGATVTTEVLMVLVAYSDRLNPVDHPVLACAGIVFPFFLIFNMLLLVTWLCIKWRKMWMPLMGFVLAYPSIRIYMPLHLHQEPPEGSIKVVSYNVASFYYDKKNQDAHKNIFDYLSRQKPDIVCLQEDVNMKKEYQDSLLHLLPYYDTIHINRPSSPLINALGVRSRYPIIGKERIQYETQANGSAAFFLKIDNDTVIVVNNHLESTHLSDSDRQRYTDMINGDMTSRDAQAETRMLVGKLGEAMVKRAPQAEAVHRYISEHSRYPIIVCGDFNDTPISYVRRTIANGLVDCFVESGCGLGVSYTPKGFFVRIDQLMCSHHYKPYGCFVDNSIHASDHYPVVGWLQRMD